MQNEIQQDDVSGGYSSDAILNGPDSLFECLAAVIRSFLLHGTVSMPLLACAFLPLLKSLKDPAKTESYRAIAGSSLILKLIDNVIILLWGDLLSSDSLQFGFKAKVSTTQCSWLVTEVASHYIRSGSPVIATLLDCSKAFDKCEFVALFEKLLKRKLPPIVVRMMIFIYTEQEAWVKWGSVKSEKFRISNGTRQGSVLSPTLFAVYLDDLLVELRNHGLGCHMAGLWVGAVAFADDLLLMAPSRAAMAKMLEICEQYGEKLNLVFSTDPCPSKSKSKAIYMTGSLLRHMPKPVPLKLYGKDLPWVSHATHLGHEMHEDGTMDFDCKCKRGKFIENSLSIRETFKFAKPSQVLKAVQTNCCDLYGSMLWNLYGEQAGQYYRSWSTCTKLVWDLPRSTHSFFVDNMLSCGFPSVRSQVLSRYVKFFHTLLSSPSKEVAVIARLVGGDAGSNTGRNMLNIRLESKLNPATSPILKMKEFFYRITEVPESERWRLPLLTKYVNLRSNLVLNCSSTEYIDTLIESLCSS